MSRRCERCQAFLRTAQAYNETYWHWTEELVRRLLDKNARPGTQYGSLHCWRCKRCGHITSEQSWQTFVMVDGTPDYAFHQL